MQRPQITFLVVNHVASHLRFSRSQLLVTRPSFSQRSSWLVMARSRCRNQLRVSCGTWWNDILPALLTSDMSRRRCRTHLEASCNTSWDKRYLPVFSYIDYVKTRSSKPPEDIVGQMIHDPLLAHLGHGNKHFSREKTRVTHYREASSEKV